MTLRILLSLLLLLPLVACEAVAEKGDSEGSAGGVVGYTVEVQEIEKGLSGGGGTLVSACFVANYYKGGAGVYEVTKLVGATETDSYGAPAGFTYVTIQLVEAWLPGSPAEVVLRVPGGPIGADVWQGGPFALKVQEVAGFVLWEPREDSKNFHSVAPTGLFQDRGTYYDSNAGFVHQYGELSLAEIGDLIASEVGVDYASCPKATDLSAPESPGEREADPVQVEDATPTEVDARQ